MTERDAKSYIYRISFYNQELVYEIYAKSISESEIFGFLEIQEVVFGSHSAVVVDPSEERLKREFDGVTLSMIPLHSVIRIDQVAHEGIAKIRESRNGNTVTLFPSKPHQRPEK